MTSSRGNTILFRSSQQLPRLRLGPINSFYQADLQVPLTCLVRCSLSDLQRSKVTIWYTALGVEVLRHRQK